MSRRYPVAERYEEVERDYYRGGPRSSRGYEEIDTEIARGGRELDFLREDYGRPASGALVLRERDRPRRARSVEREEEEEVVVRRNDRDRYRRTAEREEVDVSIRREEGRPRRRPREFEREVVIERDDVRRPKEFEREVVIERDDVRRPKEFEREVVIERDDVRRPSRNIEREDVRIRRSESARRPSRREVDYEVDIRRDERNRGRVVEDREEVSVRTRSRSRPRVVEREEEEEILVRHRTNSSRSPRGETEEEIIIRHKEERPPPFVELEPIIRPPIHQEIHQDIITHHRHIDHGVERARSRSPLPPPPGRKVDETIEVDIRRRGRNGNLVKEDIIIDTERGRGRSRSVSPGRSVVSRQFEDDDFADEAEYYNRKAMERAYIGEGYDGATRDWAIVDVPPGTRRVRMDGAGGGSQEITWQRYNGVRRSKFMIGDREYDTGFGASGSQSEGPLPPVQRPSDMWTEITKDLVIKEALEIMRYSYEETEFFYYVMDYLRYEEVLQLVELSQDLLRERRRRLRELELERIERQRLEYEAARDRRRYDDRIYEREVVIDRRR